MITLDKRGPLICSTNSRQHFSEPVFRQPPSPLECFPRVSSVSLELPGHRLRHVAFKLTHTAFQRESLPKPNDLTADAKRIQRRSPLFCFPSIELDDKLRRRLKPCA